MGALRLKETQPTQRLFIHGESPRRTIRPKKYNAKSLILALISVIFCGRTDLCKATPISKISVLLCDKYSSNYSY